MNLNITSTKISMEGEDAVITIIVPAAKLGQLKAAVGDAGTFESFATKLVNSAAQSLLDGAVANARINAANQAQAAIEAAVQPAE